MVSYNDGSTYTEYFGRYVDDYFKLTWSYIGVSYNDGPIYTGIYLMSTLAAT